jgi:hypothetical protein
VQVRWIVQGGATGYTVSIDSQKGGVASRTR